jgi:shikimate dehydrogenase
VKARYAVIGNPVAHSKSPWIHAEFARATGQDIDYGRIEAPPGGFAAAADAFRAAGGQGLNVTLPFKQDAYRYCIQVAPRAAAAQAVNTVMFGEPVKGDNTDGVGLIRDIEGHLGLSLAAKKVLLVGAGGAAQGVLGALLDARVARLVLANRTVARAEALAARFAGVSASPFAALKGDFDVVINATSAGLSDAPLPLPKGVLGRGVLAYDMVYGRDTPFLAAARAGGARTSDGLGMLVEQAAESFFLWRGVRPETRAVLARLRAG